VNAEEAAIRCLGLTKAFGKKQAVSNLELEVQTGELFGLVGPDGAGKTTTIRLLASIMRPSSGDALVAGYSISKEPELVKQKIGYMSQRFGLYEDLSVGENIDFYADLYEVPSTVRAEQTERLLSFSNLGPFTGRLAGALSGGMKQKLGLACALVHTPEVLLLDEPTSGVDPVSRRDFWKLLYGLLRGGITILLSTSYLDEAERCSRVGLIHEGSLLVTDNPTNIRKSLPDRMFQLGTDDSRTAALLLRALPGVQQVSVYGDRIHIAVREIDVAEWAIGELERNGIRVRGQREIVPSLEDIFVSMVKGRQ